MVSKATGLMVIFVVCVAAFIYHQQTVNSTANQSSIKKNYFPATGSNGLSYYPSEGEGIGLAEPSPSPSNDANTPSPTANPNVAFDIFSSLSDTQEVTSINWGSLSPGSSTGYDLYLKNTSADATSLVGFSGSTSNWNPANASNYMDIYMVYVLVNGTEVNNLPSPLNQGQQVHARLYLEVYANITNIANFSFEITITAMYA